MRRLDALAVVAIIVVITLAFSDVLFGGSCFFLRDLTRYYFPTKRILHDIVRGGEFPLWNPYYSAGQPAAANPEYYVFYPGQWPIFLRDFFLGFRLHIVLHVYIAALGMYALMRTIGTGAAAALATAFAFVFGGAILSVLNLLTFLYPLSWLPATLLFVWRRNYAIAAVFFGIQTLAFEPSILIDTVVLIAAVGFWRRDWRALLVIPAGLTIGAAQLVPMFDLVRHTPRARGLTFDMVAFWSMPPSRLVEMLQPHWFGRNPLTSFDYWGSAAYGQAATPFLLSIYVGLAAVVAIVTGLVVRSSLAIGATALACLSWVLAFGEHTPLLRVLYDTGLPVPIRFPERFAVLGVFVILVASGVMLDRIIGDGQVRRVALRVALAFLIFHAIAAIVSVHTEDWLLMAARAAALALILVLPRRVGFALIALTLADLLPLVREVSPVKPRAFFDAPPVARELRQPSNGYRIFHQPEWSGGPITRRYFSDPARTYDVLRNGMFPRLPAAWRFRTVFERDVDQTNLQVTHELVEAMWKVRDAGRRDWQNVFMAMANVGYVAAFRPYPNANPIAFVPAEGNPRYWLADEIVSGGDFVQRIVRERHSLSAAYVQGVPAFVPAQGAITRVAERANRVTIELIAQSRGFLVAANTYDEHWHATIDGTPAPVIRTNVAFQGVVVPPGRHVVELRYRNRFIAIGVAITVLALAAACTIAARTPSLRASRGARAGG